jgi:hypothetical protein
VERMGGYRCSNRQLRTHAPLSCYGLAMAPKTTPGSAWRPTLDLHSFYTGSVRTLASPRDTVAQARRAGEGK